MDFVDDPASAPPLAWGIIGTGGIASAFATAVAQRTRAHVVAVGSRDYDRAEVFATRHQIPTTHDSYQALVDDPQVQAVYVASPHSEHRAHALLAIAAGKHVLVEKAFTRNAAEAEEVIAAARAAGVFLMEAMWTRFLPHVAAVRSLLADGAVGRIVTLQADHGQFFDVPPEHRLLNPDLAGGALLDLGVYPVSFAHDILGVPESITAVGALTDTGVDGQVSMIFSYDGGRTQAVLHTTQWARTPTTMAITGTEGGIVAHGTFYSPTGITLRRHDGSMVDFDRDVPHGLAYEAAEVSRCVHTGLVESPRMTWANTVAVMRSLDEVRAAIGLRYPGE